MKSSRIILLHTLIWFIVSCCFYVTATSSTTQISTNSIRERRLAALMGAFVADAAAMPLHWIYDTNAIESILIHGNRSDTPEFFPVSHAPFYDYPIGEFTPFGEQMFVYTDTIAKSGNVHPQEIANAYTKYYTAPMNESRPFVSYVDNATKGFLKNVEAGHVWPHTGAGDTETNAIAHVLPIVVMLAGTRNFLRDAEAAIRVVQDNPDAVAFGMTFARILERVILGDSIDAAVSKVIDILEHGTGNPNDRFFAHGLKKMKEWHLRPPFDVTLELGQACDFPFHILTAPHLLLHSKNTTFVDAIRQTIKIGGENANRGSFVGSILAAQTGNIDAAIPQKWKEKTAKYAETLKLANMIVDNSIYLTEQHKNILNTTSSTKILHEHNVKLSNSPGCIAHSNSTTSNATHPPSHPDDLKALRSLYLSTEGPLWIRNACWLNKSVPICWWDQVLCNTTTWRVRELRLASNNLAGTLHKDIGILSHLEVLQLTFNRDLVGPVPDEIGNLKQLQRFYAWNTSLESLPVSIGGLEALRAIDLTDNHLQGALPATLAQLSNVDTVYFDGNEKLKCPLDTEIKQWLSQVKYHADPCKHTNTSEKSQ